MLAASGLPHYLWGEAVLHSVLWIQNQVPTRALSENVTPHEKGTGKKPDLTYLQEWGATAWVKKTKPGKLDSQVEKGYFVGFDSESKGMRIYWPGKRSVTIERDVYFDKNKAMEPEEV